MDLLESQYGVRTMLLEDLERDLVGPLEPSDTEVIEDPPVTRYVAGMLFPLDAEDDGRTDIDESDDGDDLHAPDPGVARAASRFPSSCGITLAVDAGRSPRLRFIARAARYLPLGPDGAVLPPDRWDRQQVLAGSWLREPVELEPVEFAIDRTADAEVELADGVSLFVRVRAADTLGVRAVTAVLRNTRTVPHAEVRDPHVLFQVALDVHAADGSPAFVDRGGRGGRAEDTELDSYRLLYRNAHSFAVGHGCSADWEESTDEPGRAVRVSTTFIPTATVNVAESNAAVTTPALSMRFCATASEAELLAALDLLVAGYRAWIEARSQEALTLPDELGAIARRHLEACTRAADRLTQGIDHLRADERSRLAFRLANEAMRVQRLRSDWIRDGAAGDGPPADEDMTWRPFQLSFILLCLQSTAVHDSPERGIADLLWFPTGGGKTEAYLGLVAFALFRRRLANDSGAAGGVTVIMRYTMRLLTMQQFARAALLICCCEDLRRRTPQLGEAPISIGLWVGRAGTPNTRERAEAVLRTLAQTPDVAEENPKQLQTCPWCGTPLATKNYWLGQHPPRLVIDCSNKSCTFTKGLPAYVVDEDLYDHRPSLVIATADKFAALPSNERVGELFGIGGDALPPELIVQDELHLISGPLGTLTGLYETAIDWLCERAGAVPKIVASTATIRRAGDQTSALFHREMEQFPPPGLDARDSYFAVEVPPEQRGNRLYAGVMASATSQTTAMVRVYARLLASTELDGSEDSVRDPYWTLIGYFNSLRVLGGARMQVQDDVIDRMKLLMGKDSDRSLEPIEMTSRVASGDIPEHLRLMERRLGGPDDPMDVVLATNMISVGVDVDRLGLMVVMGQPQGTAEYIQATSRVGRRHPGLVVTVFNAARSRDRSHYEAFISYHGALYRQVESTSVTPFASRARDRALHAVFVALCRLTVPELAPNDAAAAVGGHLGQVELAKKVILDRVAAVEPDELTATAAELDAVLERWRGLAERHPDLLYRSWNRRNPRPALLVDAAEPGELGSFPTLTSLRDVDLESKLTLIA